MCVGARVYVSGWVPERGFTRAAEGRTRAARARSGQAAALDSGGQTEIDRIKWQMERKAFRVARTDRRVFKGQWLEQTDFTQQRLRKPLAALAVCSSDGLRRPAYEALSGTV